MGVFEPKVDQQDFHLVADDEASRHGQTMREIINAVGKKVQITNHLSIENNARNLSMQIKGVSNSRELEVKGINN